MNEVEESRHRAVLPFLSNRKARLFHWLSLHQLFLRQRDTPVSREIQLDSHRLFIR